MNYATGISAIFRLVRPKKLVFWLASIARVSFGSRVSIVFSTCPSIDIFAPLFTTFSSTFSFFARSKGFVAKCWCLMVACFVSHIVFSCLWSWIFFCFRSYKMLISVCIRDRDTNFTIKAFTLYDVAVLFCFVWYFAFIDMLHLLCWSTRWYFNTWNYFDTCDTSIWCISYM